MLSITRAFSGLAAGPSLVTGAARDLNPFHQFHVSREQTLAKITGGRFIAEFLNTQGVTAFFFVPTMLSRALAEMDNMPIKRVLTHGEKAAAYMADGYARASGRPGICAAQAVGAANLAAGLRDAFMGHSR